MHLYVALGYWADVCPSLHLVLSLCAMVWLLPWVGPACPLVNKCPNIPCLLLGCQLGSSSHSSHVPLSFPFSPPMALSPTKIFPGPLGSPQPLLHGLLGVGTVSLWASQVEAALLSQHWASGGRMVTLAQ